MKKKIILLFLCLLFFSCSTIEKKYWIDYKNKTVLSKLQTGDILIKEKEFNLYGIFGHAGIMENNIVVIDYPCFGENGYKINKKYWMEKNRKIIVLRYKYMNKKFKEGLLKNLKKYSYLKYGINLNKKYSEKFYCSQYIWYVYYKTALENGYQLDIDKDGGFIVFPYDLINLKMFNIIR